MSSAKPASLERPSAPLAARSTYMLILAFGPVIFIELQAANLMISSLTTIAIAAIAFWIEHRQRRVDFFSPFAFVSGLTAIGFGVRPLLLSMQLGTFWRADWAYSHGEFVVLAHRAVVYAQIGYFCFLLGYGLLPNFLRTAPRAVRRPKAYGASLKLCLLLTLIGGAAYVYYVRSSELDLISFLLHSVRLPKTGKYVSIFLSWLFVIGNVAVLDYARIQRNAFWWILYAAHFSCSLLITLSFYDRKWAVFFLASLALYYNYRVRRLRVPAVATIVALCLAALIMLHAVRTYLYTDGQVVEFDREEFVTYELLHGSMFSYFDYFAVVIDVFQEEDCLYGYSLKYLATAYIPSSLTRHEDKYLSINQHLVDEYLASHILTCRAPAVSVFGEAYAEAGMPGLIVGLLAIGWIMRRIYDRTVGSHNDIDTVLVYVFVFQSYVLLVRAGFVAGTTTLIVNYVILKCVFLLRDLLNHQEKTSRRVYQPLKRQPAARPT